MESIAVSQRVYVPLITALVRAYQWVFGWITAGHCRFTPTCSEYFLKSVVAHGLVRGGAKGVGRLLRCHPFCNGGVDEVKA